MFPRISAFKAGNKTYKYLRIVENYRKNGKRHQRVIANLGRIDQISDKIDGLVDKLRKYCNQNFVRADEIEGKETPVWGPILALRKLWSELELDEIIRKRCSKYRKGLKVEDTAFVLVASSLVEPCSEHGLARWLEKSYVCDSQGKRFLPEWKDKVTKKKRVRVKWGQLKIWYRTIDALLKAKEEIEKDIYLRLRDLFGLKVDIVFYDITSLYFEGSGPAGLAEFGKSKDGKNRNKQILLGVVMANGWPVAHHVYCGKQSEKTVVPEVINDLKERFEIEKLIFVGDSGFISADNLKHITEKGYKYIVGMKRRRCRETEEVLKKLKKDKWEDCPKTTQVQEVKLKDERFFVAKSEKRQEYEKAMRKNNMKVTLTHLKELQKSVEKGNLKEPEKIGYKVSSILKKVKGHRYFSWEITKEGKFRYWLDKEKVKKEWAIEGKYLLKSNDEEIKPAEAVKAYKELSNIESAFREFKDVLEGRPIWHQTEKRVKGHVFIKALGYLLDTALDKVLKKNDVNLTVEKAIDALKNITIAELKLKGENHQIVCGTSKQYVRQILKALRLSDYKNMLPSQISSNIGKKMLN